MPKYKHLDPDHQRYQSQVGSRPRPREYTHSSLALTPVKAAFATADCNSSNPSERQTHRAGVSVSYPLKAPPPPQTPCVCHMLRLGSNAKNNTPTPWPGSKLRGALVGSLIA